MSLVYKGINIDVARTMNALDLNKVIAQADNETNAYWAMVMKFNLYAQDDLHESPTYLAMKNIERWANLVHEIYRNKMDL